MPEMRQALSALGEELDGATVGGGARALLVEQRACRASSRTLRLLFQSAGSPVCSSEAPAAALCPAGGASGGGHGPFWRCA